MIISQGVSLARLLSFSTTMFLFGSAVFLRCFASEPFSSLLARQLHRSIVACVGLATVAILTLMPLTIIEMAGGWNEMAKPGLVSAILWDTTPGHVILIRIGLIFLLAASLFFWPTIHLPMLVVSAFLLASFALSGHAVMDEGVRGVIHQANDVIHVLSGAAWIGSLPALMLCLVILRKPESAAQSRSALCNFSFAGHAAVALVLLTGVGNVLFVVGPPASWLAPSPYRALLLLKFMLVLCMVGLALVNRYVWVPRLKERGEIAIDAIRRRTIAELMLGAGVLCLVAVFGQLDPM